MGFGHNVSLQTATMVVLIGWLSPAHSVGQSTHLACSLRCNIDGVISVRLLDLALLALLLRDIKNRSQQALNTLTPTLILLLDDRLTADDSRQRLRLTI